MRLRRLVDAVIRAGSSDICSLASGFEYDVGRMGVRTRRFGFAPGRVKSQRGKLGRLCGRG
jgi:hypothetical protein